MYMLQAPSQPDGVVTLAGADVRHPLAGVEAEPLENSLRLPIAVPRLLVGVCGRDDGGDRPIRRGEGETVRFRRGLPLAGAKESGRHEEGGDEAARITLSCHDANRSLKNPILWAAQ